MDGKARACRASKKRRRRGMDKFTVPGGLLNNHVFSQALGALGVLLRQSAAADRPSESASPVFGAGFQSGIQSNSSIARASAPAIDVRGPESVLVLPPHHHPSARVSGDESRRFSRRRVHPQDGVRRSRRQTVKECLG